MATESQVIDQVAARTGISRDKLTVLESFPQVLDKIVVQWPRGTIQYPTTETLALYQAADTLTLGVMQETLARRGSSANIVTGAEDDQIDRIVDGLDRKRRVVFNNYARKIADAARAGAKTVTLPTSFRDDLLAWLIEIHSSLFGLARLAEAHTWFVEILGDAVLLFVRGSSGVVFLLKKFLEALGILAKELTKFVLGVIPGWVWAGALLLGGLWFVRRSPT